MGSKPMAQSPSQAREKKRGRWRTISLFVSDRHPGIPGWGLYDRPLFCCRLHSHRIYPNDLSAACILLEGHVTVAERKKRMIGADADIAARMELGAALTHDDV